MKSVSKVFLIVLFIILSFLGYLFFSIPDLLHRNRVVEVKFNDCNGDVLFTRLLKVEDWSIASNPYLADAFVKSRDIEYKNANFCDMALAEILVGLYPDKEGFLDYIRSKLLLYKLHLFYTSEELIELYMKNAYFGRGVWGLKNAANFYFGKNVKSLLIEEIAFLVARLNSQETKSPSFLLTNLNEILTVMDHDISQGVKYHAETENVFFSYIYKLLGRRLKVVNATVNIYTSFDPILDSNVIKILQNDLLRGNISTLEFIVFSKGNKVRSIYLRGDKHKDKDKEYRQLTFLESIVDEFNEVIYRADTTGEEVLDYNFRVGDNFIFCKISPKSSMKLWEKFIISLNEKVEVKHGGGRSIFDAINFTENKSMAEEGKYNIKGIIWRSQNGK